MGLQACYSLGLDALPGASAADWQVKVCEGEATVQAAEGVRWQLSEIDTAPEVVTERNLLGRITRYVQPFTAHTVVFALSIENTSAQTLWLQPEQMMLQYTENTEKSLDNTFFEASWPAAAVRTSRQMLDRSQAMAEVYRSLLRARPVLPGESYQGRLVFRRHRTAPQVLQIQEQRLGQQHLSLQFCLQALKPQD